MLINHPNQRRRAGVLVETAISTSVFVTLIIGTVDLGIYVFRIHVVQQATRQGARAAIVHGSLASSTWNGGPWGPTTYGPVTVSGNTSDPRVSAISRFLSGVDTSKVQVTYEWPDGSNLAEKRVRVTVTTSWTPIFASIFGAGTQTITSQSTMLIAH
ncbi:MAG TPA: TadE/TadG family type IV pilus assembly protein [Isosphaeraceae bacterium]|nr:TadE/TadG family type IV pilus assembly protein [Isosphaeraceae bacterium]